MSELPKAVVIPPESYSERIQGYFEQHSNDPWQNHLRFVLETFPQVRDGKVQYLLYGGAAIRLLHPGRLEPRDIDIVTRNQEMAAEFPPHPEGPPIDVHAVERWLQEHQLPFNQKIIDFLFEQHRPATFEEHQVLVMSPVALAWSKQNVLWGNLKRPKDLEDIRLLNVDLEELRIYSERIKQFSQSQ